MLRSPEKKRGFLTEGERVKEDCSIVQDNIDIIKEYIRAEKYEPGDGYCREEIGRLLDDTEDKINELTAAHIPGGKKGDTELTEEEKTLRNTIRTFQGICDEVGRDGSRLESPY